MNENKKRKSPYNDLVKVLDEIIKIEPNTLYDFEFKFQATSLEDAAIKAIELLKEVDQNIDVTYLHVGDSFNSSRIKVKNNGNKLTPSTKNDE